MCSVSNFEICNKLWQLLSFQDRCPYQVRKVLGTYSRLSEDVYLNLSVYQDWPEDSCVFTESVPPAALLTHTHLNPPPHPSQLWLQLQTTAVTYQPTLSIVTHAKGVMQGPCLRYKYCSDMSIL